MTDTLPRSAQREMAWSMPPPSIATVASDLATSEARRLLSITSLLNDRNVRAEQHVSADEEDSPEPSGTLPQPTNNIS